MIHITAHAIQRYRERVEPVTKAIARERILASAHAIETAIRFGASHVILGCGAKLVLDGASVVTVLPKHRPFTYLRLNGGRVVEEQG